MSIARNELINLRLDGEGIKQFREYLTIVFPRLDPEIVQDMPIEAVFDAIMQAAKTSPAALVSHTIPNAPDDIKRYLENDLERLLKGEFGFGGLHKKTYRRVSNHGSMTAGTSNYLIVHENLLDAVDSLRTMVGNKAISLKDKHEFVTKDQGRSLFISKLQEFFPEVADNATFQEGLRLANEAIGDLKIRFSQIPGASVILKKCRITALDYADPAKPTSYYNHLRTVINDLSQNSTYTQLTRSFYETLGQAVIDANQKKIPGIKEVFSGNVAISFHRLPTPSGSWSERNKAKNAVIAKIASGDYEREITFHLTKGKLEQLTHNLSDALGQSDTKQTLDVVVDILKNQVNSLIGPAK